MNCNDIATVIFIGCDRCGWDEFEQAEHKYRQDNVVVYKNSFNNIFQLVSTDDDYELVSLLEMMWKKEEDCEIVIGMDGIGRAVDEIL